MSVMITLKFPIDFILGLDIRLTIEETYAGAVQWNESNLPSGSALATESYLLIENTNFLFVSIKTSLKFQQVSYKNISSRFIFLIHSGFFWS